ncbi:E3 SUMO-protein ligase ZBED1 [Frankliniella fusca]|uniref:E3 SUMO-protein ligase ZBED1 n=1 Tax=Frankliniella fusca TaxID=407009 RepID=A0AAE1HNW9_9NEOP|nr:E3 SUMO-protein ligase ZBED1 [Frankliniella fusca]
MKRSRKRSAVWDHFGEKGADARVKCKYCPTTVSVQQGCTTNMMNHLRVKHLNKYLMVTGERTRQEDGVDENDEDDLEVSAEVVGGNPLSPTVTVSSAAASLSPSPTPSNTEFSPPVSPAPSASRVRAASCTPSKSSYQPSLDAYRCDSKTTERLHFAVTYYIVTNNRPLNTVEKDGFRAMLHAFKPTYKVLSRRTLTETYVPKAVEQVRSHIKGLLKEAEVYSLTSDNWTSGADVPFTSLTAHFFDKSWDNLHAVTLACRATHQRHTGLNLKDFFVDELNSWDLKPEQCAALTTDNASEMRVAAELLLVPHMRCIGHTIQNGVEDLLGSDAIKPVIKEARALLTWSNTPKKVHQSVPKVLPSVSPTRWWSELTLLKQIVESYDYLREFAASYQRGKHLNIIPGEKSIFIIRALVRSLRPLEDIVNDLSGDNYVTASAVLPVLNLLEAGFEGDDDLEDGEGEEPMGDSLDFDNWDFDSEAFRPVALREYVTRKLKKRYCPGPLDEVECHNLLAKCSFLDPRYKGEIHPEEREKAKKLLTEEFLTSVEKDAESLRSELEGVDAPSTSASAPARKRSALQSLFAKKKRAPDGSGDGTSAANLLLTPEAKFKEELARYDNVPNINMELDIRIWWKERTDAYPYLQGIARKYLSICATSTSSERLFSSGGNVVTDSRCCLSDVNAGNLIFLSSNKKFLKRP